MAQNKKKNQKQTQQKMQKQKQQTKKVVAPSRTLALDNGARAYAMLLNDPCGASLVHPVYIGSDTGYLGRYSVNLTVNVTAGNTAGVVYWQPNRMDTNATNLQTGETNSPSTGIVIAPPVGTTAPGFSFLTTTAGEQRCVAACMKVTYTGSELNRQGVLALASLNAQSMALGSAVIIDQMITVSQMTVRVPDRTVEVKWRPGAGDEMFRSVDGTKAYENAASMNALAFSYKGLPSTGTGYFNVELIAVHEWIPTRTQGVMFTTRDRNTSNATLDHVINFLDGQGPAWQFANTAVKIAGTVASLML